MTKPKVYVVTPVFNAENHIDNFMLSLKRQNYTNLKVVLVDDGSTDRTVDFAKKYEPLVSVLNSPGDQWWSGSTNIGVKHAIAKGADFIFTVNVDVALDKKCISSLVEEAKEHTSSLIGATVYDQKDKDKIWYMGGSWSRKSGEMIHVTSNIIPEGSKFAKADWLTGMGVLIPSGLYKKIGYYDNRNFPQYYGDADFSLRASKSGYDLIVCSSAKVYADLSSSWLEKWLARPNITFPVKLFFSLRSPHNINKRRLFYKKYWGRGYRKALFRQYTTSLWPLYRLWIVLILKKFMRRT